MLKKQKKLPKHDLVHHQKSSILLGIREIVFGMEDGMVSTLGALTGIAIGTRNHFVIVLSGLVIIAVESISMGVGSYLSAKSVKEIKERKLSEEKIEIEKSPESEKNELIEMYTKDGWPLALAKKMALVASKNKELFIKEMAYHELFINLSEPSKPIKEGFYMFFSYIIAGSIPIFPYIFLSVSMAIPVSVIITLLGLFILGSVTTKFTKRCWWKAGLEMFVLAGVACAVGYSIGALANLLLV